MDTHRRAIDEATSTLDDVDAALARLSDGSYRSCEVCGEVIGEDLLVVTPTRRRCAEHDAA